MNKYRDLRWAFTTTPPLETLTGGRIARAHRILETHRQADSLLGNWRNVVARVGLHGAESFQVPNGVMPDTPDQVYPLRSVSRVVARMPPFAVLPGHAIKVSALYLPAGLTQKLDGDWQSDGAAGRIDVIVNFTGPAASTKIEKQQLVASNEVYAGESPGAGAAWASLRRVEFPDIFPAKVKTSIADARTWSEGCIAEVSVLYRGGVRCVDLCVQQVPIVYARDVDADTVFSSPLLTDPVGKPLKAYPVQFPIVERTATDPTSGSLLLADVTHRQHTALGPVLCHWTAFAEDSAPIDATQVPSVTTTSTTFVNMLRTSITAHSDDHPGMSLSAGSMSQQFKSSNGLRELRGKDTCVPVRCWAYCSRTGANDAYLRFQTADYSVCELVVTSSSAGWVSAIGHLRAGAHPEDPSVLEVFGRAGGSSTLSLSQVFVEYIDA